MMLMLILGGTKVRAQTAGAGQGSALAPARERFALVIGNSNYRELPRLANPANDATDMAKALESLGFTVESLNDADLSSMEDSVLRLGNRLAASQGAIGFFYYAGHGVQSGSINYLIPADAKISAESFLKTKALPLPSVMDILQGAKNGLNVIVLDACRDNPFSWARSSGSRGLTVVGAQPSGSIIVYATGAGSVARDGTGRNGAFTQELLKYISQPGLEINEVFKRTGKAVGSATNNAQVPAIYSQYFESAYLAGLPAGAGSSGGTAVGVTPVSAGAGSTGSTTTLASSDPTGQAAPTQGALGADVVAAAKILPAAVLVDPAVRARELRAEIEAFRIAGLKLARKDENLRGYLGQIAALEDVLAKIGADFGLLAEAEKRRIGGEHDAKALAATSSEIKPWETDEEYVARKAANLAAVEAARSTALAAAETARGTERSVSEKDLKAMLVKANADLTAKVWTIRGTAVKLESQAFDRANKTWPVRLVSLDPALSYSGIIGYSMKSVADIEQVYTSFDAGLKAGTIEGEIQYGYERVPGKDIVRTIVKNLKLTDRKSSKVLVTTPLSAFAHASRASNPDIRLGGLPKVRIESVPSGAKVSLEGKDLGATPLDLVAEPGNLLYMVTWDSSTSYEFEAELEYGDSKTLVARIPTTGQLSVTTEPLGALISVDGVERGTGPLVLRELQAGSVTVSAKLDGYVETSQTKTIELGKTMKLSLALLSTKVAIGDVYGGGIIVSLDGKGGGLVAAPTDQSASATWATAVQICSSLVLNGVSGWRLPTKDELNLMYTNLHKQSRGGFASAWYWSSSEGSSSIAWVQDFSDGSQGGGSKVGNYHVRAVRAF
jgi:hypothetical protein